MTLNDYQTKSCDWQMTEIPNYNGLKLKLAVAMAHLPGLINFIANIINWLMATKMERLNLPVSLKQVLHYLQTSLPSNKHPFCLPRRLQLSL